MCVYIFNSWNPPIFIFYFSGYCVSKSFHLTLWLFFQIVPPDFRDQVDLLAFQAYIAQQKYNVVINEVPESHELPEYRIVLLLAKQLAGSYSKWVLL